jgi:hypothetical protein
MGSNASVFNINAYDLVFVYADKQAMSMSRAGHGSASGPRAAFAAFNGLDPSQRCTFLGCATTQYIATMGTDAIFSMTTSGIVTVDCTSYQAFKDGDLVAWKVPSALPGGSAGDIGYPYHPKDAQIGRLRCVLYPVRMRSPGQGHSIANKALLMAMHSIKASVRAGGGSVANAAIKRLQQSDKGSQICKHLDAVLQKGEPLDTQMTQNLLGQDMWAFLSHLARQDTPPQGRSGSMDKSTAWFMAALGYLATSAVIRQAVHPRVNNEPHKISLRHENVLIEDQADRELYVAQMDADLLFTMVRFAGFIAEYDRQFEKHQIVGLCMRSCAAGAVVNLDIWLGRKT